MGYSDDQVLFRTSDVGGFLQNAEVGVGTMPQVSGFQPIDDLGIASESFSDKYAFFKRNKVLNEAGDHYYITQSPVVNSTEFKEYDIPLKIYRDKVKLGASKDYTMSSFFESLYIDIYPLPVGASFARVDLVVKHRPAGAIALNTFGYQNKFLANRHYDLLPTRVKDSDSAVNSLFDDITSLSLLENLPHGYSRNKTLKKVKN